MLETLTDANSDSMNTDEGIPRIFHSQKPCQPPDAVR